MSVTHHILKYAILFFHPRVWLFHRYITRLHIFSLYRVEIQFIKFKIQFLENMNLARFEPWPLESITFAHMTGKLDHVREQCHSSCRSWFQDAGDVTCKIWLTLLFVTWKFSLFLFGSFFKDSIGVLLHSHRIKDTRSYRQKYF